MVILIVIQQLRNEWTSSSLSQIGCSPVIHVGRNLQKVGGTGSGCFCFGLTALDKKKHVLLAQTMPDTSFGPIFLIVSAIVRGSRHVWMCDGRRGTGLESSSFVVCCPRWWWRCVDVYIVVIAGGDLKVTQVTCYHDNP